MSKCQLKGAQFLHIAWQGGRGVGPLEKSTISPMEKNPSDAHAHNSEKVFAWNKKWTLH